MKPLKIGEEARDEFLRETKYLESQRKGVGKRFRIAVNSAFSLIRQFPDGGKLGAAETRRIVVRDFDFVVIYRDEGSHVFVYAVASTRREPNYWASRVDDA